VTKESAVQMAKSHVSMRTRAAQQVSVTAGRLTSRARVLPNLLIVGSQRCGTTTLYRTLTQHPAVAKAVLHKGVHYFDVGYDHDLSWYRAHFPLRATLAARERRVGVPPVVLESSPYYMFHPLAPERIARDLPETRVIALVRDPVERAYSAHSHELARGFETEPFERALELEESRLAGEVDRMRANPGYESHAHRHNAYLLRGQYVEQLEELERTLGRERLLVLDSQEFWDVPERAYASVLDFLGLPALGQPVFEQHNARRRAPMSDALRQRLDEHFAPFDERLAKWWGQTPSWRR
jgi:hypothetical protein